MTTRILAIITAIVLTTGSASAHCGKCGVGEEKAHDHGAASTGTAVAKSGGEMTMGGTMGMVFTAEKLYTCPMHSEVVSADAEKPCPLCKMALKEMGTEQIAKLRDSHPKGCPMDLIVAAGDSKTETCPVCKMKLVPIEKDRPPMEPKKVETH